MSRAILRLHQPGIAQVREQYIDTETPVIITGVADTWPASTRWTPEYLKAAVGDLIVPVAENPRGEYFDADVLYGDIRLREMPWHELLDAVFSPRPGEPVRYLRQRPIADFGTLAADIQPPAYMPRPSVLTNIWVGAAPSTTATHYDSEDNFLVQISGRKQLTLFPSAQLAALYPFSVMRGAFNHSQVDIERPDLQKFPDFAAATPYTCTLNPGEMLYIPIHWWHRVQTIESGVSVNFWWKPLPSQARRIAGLRFLPASAKAGHLPHTLATMLPGRVGSFVVGGYDTMRNWRRRLRGRSAAATPASRRADS